jgi:hypothetical protein
VKIYSVRVDAVHSEAYKVLGRINRAGIENEQGLAVTLWLRTRIAFLLWFSSICFHIVNPCME